MSERKQAELIDRVRYPNPLPLPPYPPKLQRVDVSSARYADGPETQGRVGGNLAINFTERLARANQLPVLVDAEGGIPMDLTQFPGVWTGDTDRFAPRMLPDMGSMELDDEDRFLLTPLSQALNGSSGAAAAPSAARKTGTADVTWLRRTEYLSSAAARSEKPEKPKQRSNPDDIMHTDTSREAAIKRINDTFVAVQETNLANLRHPTKKHLRAVSSHEFLPDIDTWASNYQLVRFQDWPGRTRAGRPAPDPRVAEALLRPVQQGSDQRISLYLVSSSEKDATVDKNAIPNANGKQKDPVPEGESDEDEGLFGGSDSEDEGKSKPTEPQPLGSAAGTPTSQVNQNDVDDQAAIALAQRRLKGQVVSLDAIQDGQAPEAAGTDFKLHRDYQAGENDARPNNQYVIVLTQEGNTTAASQAQSDWQARHLTAKGRKVPVVGSDKKRNVAYYHPVAMQYTLRQKRIRKNESVRYPDMWASVHASDRAMYDSELKKTWRSRRQVDRLDPSLEMDLSDSEMEEEEEEEEEEEGKSTTASVQRPQPERERDSSAGALEEKGDHDVTMGEAADGARKRASASPRPPSHSPEAQEAEAEQQEGSASGSGSESGSDDEADPEEMDDELAALQAEAHDQGDEPTLGRRQRRPVAAPAEGVDAPEPAGDDDEE